MTALPLCVHKPRARLETSRAHTWTSAATRVIMPQVLIHGWSGSQKYFALNVEALAHTNRVITYDLRFHGARYAAL